MKKPKVVLKNLKYHEGHDGYGMNADVWIDNVNCMHVYDSAHGGGYEYTHNTYKNPNAEKVKSLIKNLEDYIKTLPEKEYDFGGKKVMVKPDLDGFICDIEAEMEKEKTKKKMIKHMANAILFGVPNADMYHIIKFKVPLSKIPQGILQAKVLEIQSKECKGNVQILNTNLKELGIRV